MLCKNDTKSETIILSKYKISKINSETKYPLIK